MASTGTRSKSRKTGVTTSGEKGCSSQNSDTNNIGGSSRPISTTDTTTTTTNAVVPDVAEITTQELSNTNLPGDMQSLVTIICKVMQSQLDSYFSKMINLNNKDKQIDLLKSKISALENKIIDLETTIDGVDQYERRDTYCDH